MTWRLRFYDDSGVEIGYAEKPDKYTYNVVITHLEPGWDDFEERLGLSETIFYEKDEASMQSPGWIADSGPMNERWQPEAHLVHVRDTFSHPAVASTELNDE